MPYGWACRPTSAPSAKTSVCHATSTVPAVVPTRMSASGEDDGRHGAAEPGPARVDLLPGAVTRPGLARRPCCETVELMSPPAVRGETLAADGPLPHPPVLQQRPVRCCETFADPGGIGRPGREGQMAKSSGPPRTISPRAAMTSGLRGCPLACLRTDPCGIEEQDGRRATDVERAHEVEVVLRVDLHVRDPRDHGRHLLEDPARGPAGLAEGAGELHDRGPLAEPALEGGARGPAPRGWARPARCRPAARRPRARDPREPSAGRSLIRPEVRRFQRPKTVASEQHDRRRPTDPSCRTRTRGTVDAFPRPRPDAVEGLGRHRGLGMAEAGLDPQVGRHAGRSAAASWMARGCSSGK